MADIPDYPPAGGLTICLVDGGHRNLRHLFQGTPFRCYLAEGSVEKRARLHPTPLPRNEAHALMLSAIGFQS